MSIPSLVAMAAAPTPASTPSPAPSAIAIASRNYRERVRQGGPRKRRSATELVRLAAMSCDQRSEKEKKAVQNFRHRRRHSEKQTAADADHSASVSIPVPVAPVPSPSSLASSPIQVVAVEPVPPLLRATKPILLHVTNDPSLSPPSPSPFASVSNSPSTSTAAAAHASASITSERKSLVPSVQPTWDEAGETRTRIILNYRYGSSRLPIGQENGRVANRVRHNVPQWINAVRKQRHCVGVGGTGEHHPACPWQSPETPFTPLDWLARGTIQFAHLAEHARKNNPYELIGQRVRSDDPEDFAVFLTKGRFCSAACHGVETSESCRRYWDEDQDEDRGEEDEEEVQPKKNASPHAISPRRMWMQFRPPRPTKPTLPR